MAWPSAPSGHNNDLNTRPDDSHDKLVSNFPRPNEGKKQRAKRRKKAKEKKNVQLRAEAQQPESHRIIAHHPRSLKSEMDSSYRRWLALPFIAFEERVEFDGHLAAQRHSGGRNKEFFFSGNRQSFQVET